MTFTNKVYDILKFLAQYFFPACGTLYFALARIWNLPYGTEIVGTISAVDAFLGVLLGISSASYNGDGQLVVDSSDDEKDVYSLNLSIPIEELRTRDKITFRVDK